MIRVPDMWKIYFFILLGVSIGYLGSFDNKNFFVLGVPTLLLLKNTEFNCYTTQVKLERQKSFNLGLTIIRDIVDLARNFNYNNNIDELREKVQNLVKNAMGGIDLQGLMSTGISAFINQ
jgi:hypothetical protein